MNRFYVALECILCGQQHPTSTMYHCTACGPEGILEAIYDMDAVKASLTPEALLEREQSIWRYKELLPLPLECKTPPQPVGCTPVIAAPRLAKRVGLEQVWIKDDGRNPTASFKDRASAVGAAHAASLGATSVACASTGNAASSLSGMAAGLGLTSHIFVPKRAPIPKITQLKIFGANVYRVNGSYDTAYDLCTEACETHGWYNRNCAINPVLVEGKKTAGLEIAEHFGADVPEWVAVSVGDGCTIAGICKGLVQMHELGFIPFVPRVLGVQASGAAHVKVAFDADADLKPGGADTFADSIAVGHPRNWRKAVSWVRRVNGTYVDVSDDAIAEAMVLLPRLGGVFAEPAAAATWAGVEAASKQGIIKTKERVLVMVTGNGLKDIDSAKRIAGPPLDIEPSLEGLSAALEAQ